VSTTAVLSNVVTAARTSDKYNDERTHTQVSNTAVLSIAISTAMMTLMSVSILTILTITTIIDRKARVVYASDDTSVTVTLRWHSLAERESEESSG
jgi:hypothetical protein